MMRAPWRWRWGSILGIWALWGGVVIVVWWARILALAVAGWFVLWVRAVPTQPRSPTVVKAPLPDEEADQSVEHIGAGAVHIVRVHSETRRYEL